MLGAWSSHAVWYRLRLDQQHIDCLFFNFLTKSRLFCCWHWLAETAHALYTGCSVLKHPYPLNNLCFQFSLYTPEPCHFVFRLTTGPWLVQRDMSSLALSTSSETSDTGGVDIFVVSVIQGVVCRILTVLNHYQIWLMDDASLSAIVKVIQSGH